MTIVLSSMPSPFQRIEDTADVVIEFLNRVAVFAPVRAAFEFFAHAERIVEHGVRQIEKERTFLVLLDELESPRRCRASSIPRDRPDA